MNTPTAAPVVVRHGGTLERAARFGLFRADILGKRLAERAGAAFLRCAGAPSKQVHTFTSKAELAALARLALLTPRGTAALEIGSYLGASTRYLAAAISHTGSRVYCVDTWQNETMPDGPRDTFAAFSENLGPLMKWVVPIRKSSAELRREDIPEPVGFAFIDGDHSYESARRDADTVLPMLRDDATVAFHDCGSFQGVGRVIGEVLSRGEWVIAGMVDTLVWLRRGTWDASGRAVWSGAR